MAGRKLLKLWRNHKVGKKSRKKIDKREKDRLGSQAVANTKHFLHRQTFGAASPCYRIDPETGERTVVQVTKKAGVLPPKRKSRPAKPNLTSDRDRQMAREASERWSHLRDIGRDTAPGLKSAFHDKKVLNISDSDEVPWDD